MKKEKAFGIQVLRLRQDLQAREDYRDEFIVLKSGIDYVVGGYYLAEIYKTGSQSLIEYHQDFKEKLLEEGKEDKEYKGQDLNGKSLIVFRHGGIGDLIFIVACLKELKKRYPLSKLILVISSEYIPLFAGLDFIDDVRSFPLTLQELLRPDYYLDFQKVIELNPEAEYDDAYKVHMKAFSIPEWEYLILDPEIYINPDSVRYLRNTLLKTIPSNLKKIVIAPSASSPIRTPDIGLWTEFLNLIPYPKDVVVFFCGSAKETKLIDNLISSITTIPKENLINYASSSGLHNTAALISECDLLIGPDSGLVHVAGCLGIPVIGLFGAFHSNLRLTHYKKGPVIGIDVFTTCKYARGFSLSTNLDNDEHTIDEEKTKEAIEKKFMSSCYQHGGGCCNLALEVVDFYPPCMFHIGGRDLWKAVELTEVFKEFQQQKEEGMELVK